MMASGASRTSVCENWSGSKTAFSGDMFLLSYPVHDIPYLRVLNADRVGKALDSGVGCQCFARFAQAVVSVFRYFLRNVLCDFSYDGPKTFEPFRLRRVIEEADTDRRNRMTHLIEDC